MSTHQSIVCSNATADLLSLLSNHLDKNFKKAATAAQIRNKLLEFIKTNKIVFSIKAQNEDNLFTEFYKLVVSSALTVEIKLKAYNELTHSSQKLLIKRQKTFIDLNKEKENILNVFTGNIGKDVVSLIDSVFSCTRTNFLFDCESFDMEEFSFTVDYTADNFGVDLNVIRTF